MEYYNYDYLSRSYNWDGPFNATDGEMTAGPACVRSGAEPNPVTCNTEIRSTDVVGYVGGNKTSFLQVGHPYYFGF